MSWKWFWWGLAGLGTFVVAREIYLASVVRRRRKRYLFQQAQQRAQESGKRLIVVGDPDGSLISKILGPDYPCGDLCVDVYGCPACPTHIAGRLADVLPYLENDSAVIFVAALEGDIGDSTRAMLELDRISGGDLFVAHVEPLSLTALAGHRRILIAPPETAYVEYKPLPWHPEAMPAARYRVALPNAERKLGREIAAHGQVVAERRAAPPPPSEGRGQ